jgi:hypothetical protein
MREVSQAEFNSYRIGRQPGPVETVLKMPRPTIEKRWFAHNELLGIVLFDTVDSDWSFVALRVHEGEKVYRQFDCGTSFSSCGAATKRLEDVLVRGVCHTNFDTDEWCRTFAKVEELAKRHSMKH